MQTATFIKVTQCSSCGTKQGTVKGSSLCFNCFMKQKDTSSGVVDRRRVSHEEDDIQKGFFTAARQLLPQVGRLLFAVPNGGRRDRREAGRLKAQGVVAGVSDIICLIPSGGYNCLCMETKTDTGTQSDGQKEFQKEIEATGGKYVIFRSVAEGIEILQNYLNKTVKA